MSAALPPLPANVDIDADVQNRLDAITRLRGDQSTDDAARIAEIQKILGEAEALASLRKLRWPQGIVCPRCASIRVQRREALLDLQEKASEFKRYYKCLDCQDRLGNSTFDDLTGLPMDTLHSIQKWALCWHILSFCSPMKAAKLLGISVDYLLQVAVMSHDFTLLPPNLREEAMAVMTFQRRHVREQQQKIRADEEEALLNDRSSTFSFRPGPKTRGPA